MRAAILLFSFSLVVAAQAPVDWAPLEASVAEELKATNTPGAVVGVVLGDKLIYAKGFGMADIETGRPVTPDLLFRLGSTTKMMTAAALLTLAQDGKVDLHAPVGQYAKGLDPAVGKVTLHQLLSHTAGLKDEAVMFGSHDDKALGEFVRSWKGDYLYTQPGRVISYSNPGYHLAGFVLESVAGFNYANAMNDILFQPLGMKRTTLRPLMAMTYPMAQGHEVGPGKVPEIVRPAADNAAQWPAGSVFTNVEDWSRLVIAFLNEGMLDGRQVLKPGVIAAMTESYAPIPGDDGSAYGYGLVVGKERGLTFWQHGGARAGYGSILIMVPEKKAAVMVIANRSGSNLPKSAEKALEVLLHLRPEPTKPQSEDTAIDSSLAARLVGRYVNGSTVVEVKEDGGVVKAVVGPSSFALKLRGAGKVVAEKGPEFLVVQGEDGRINYLCLGLRCCAKAE